jgi:hypothetical protein
MVIGLVKHLYNVQSPVLKTDDLYIYNKCRFIFYFVLCFKVKYSIVYIRYMHYDIFTYLLDGRYKSLCSVHKYIVQVHSFTQKRSLFILLPADIPWAAQLEHVMPAYNEKLYLKPQSSNCSV